MTKNKLKVLVPEAHAVGAIGVIRSLGRAGYRVHALSSIKDALGFESKYTDVCQLSPSYENAGFLNWFRDYIKKNSIDSIIPSDGLLLALRPVIQEFEPLLALNTNLNDVYTAFSKYDVLKKLTQNSSSEVSSNLPPTVFFKKNMGLPNSKEMAHFKKPYFLKADACHARGEQKGLVKKINSVEELQRVVPLQMNRYTRMILQGYVGGIDVGVYFLIWNGQVVAEFMNKSLHSVPHTGGFYALRESCMHREIRDDALLKLTQIGWGGVAMMEYRWDPVSDKFYFIELNARFWGSLHHALYAGVDFPLFLMEIFQDKKIPAVFEFPLGVKCRYTFPLEVQYVGSVLKDREVPFKKKIWCIIEFFILFLNPKISSDLWFMKDKKLYYKSVVRTIMDIFK